MSTCGGFAQNIAVKNLFYVWMIKSGTTCVRALREYSQRNNEKIYSIY